ncbi:peptide-methionine (S)-S-oxide reductase [Nonlabens marinus]|uniref:peptide-methionine (S)-S-oxide reductase n=1 Tax=Nonlabens marinus S1-08 TaxID=1454201 RepID=W8VRU1_9FLAO|nr:peptide-methionine (S)-S-oxide reductase [Nonlabens marinus]BAO55815.1 peptide methionine sulfoxide reductase MsrA [Nonlabens marinus S1-08]
MKRSKHIGLGGGCHWCTEAVFQQLEGVLEVKQGYIASKIPADSWSEGILLEYNPSVISLEFLIDVHLETHASTVFHHRREEYRSAIYFYNQDQCSEVEVIMSSLSRKRNKSYITQLLPFVKFKESRESIRDYYRTRPEAPFCKRYIEPKLALVQQMNSKSKRGL